MINYNIRAIDVNLNQKEWEAEKSKAVLEIGKKELKATPELIEHFALNNISARISEKEIEKMKDELKDIVVLQPIVRVKKMNKNGADLVISITYYMGDELDKIELDKLNFDFKYKTITEDYFQKAFDKIIVDYPIMHQIYDPIMPEDAVTWSAIRSVNGKVIGEDNNITIKAQPSKDFSINSAILGRRLGERFQITAPDGVQFFITINDVLRAYPTNLTDQNIRMARIPEVNSLADLRKKMETDVNKDTASSELLRYFELAINNIADDNKVVMSDLNIQDAIDNYVNMAIQTAPNEFKKQELIKSMKIKDDRSKKLMELADKNARTNYKIFLIEKSVMRKGEFEVSEDEINKELKYLNTTGIGPSISVSRDQIAGILKHQKVALYLMKLNHPKIYEEVSKHINISL